MYATGNTTRAVSWRRSSFAAAAGVLIWLLTPAFGCAGAPSERTVTTMAPERPREYVDTTLVPSTGQTIPVHEGDDLGLLFGGITTALGGVDVGVAHDEEISRLLDTSLQGKIYFRHNLFMSAWNYEGWSEGVV